MKKINLIVMGIGLIGMIVLSINAIVDSYAVDIVAGVIVQIFFASLFISGYVSYNKKDTQ